MCLSAVIFSEYVENSIYLSSVYSLKTGLTNLIFMRSSLFWVFTKISLVVAFGGFGTD